MENIGSPVDEEIEIGEKVLWLGQPLDNFSVGPRGRFAIIWTAFTLFWETIVVRSTYLAKQSPQLHGAANAQSPSWFGAVCGIPFVWFGFYLIYRHFFSSRSVKRNTWYAVTNKRILIVGQYSKSRHVRGMELRSLNSIIKTWNGKNRGTLSFVLTHFISNEDISSLPPGFGTLAFTDIADINQIYDIIQKARAQV